MFLLFSIGVTSKVKMEKNITLARWLIDKTNTESYRAGTLTGWKHREISSDVMACVGGRASFIEQARRLENETKCGQNRLIIPEWRDVNTDVRKISYDIAVIPQLCVMEGIEDARAHQLGLIANVQKWREEGKAYAWLCAYYDDILRRLEAGKSVQEAEDETRFLCINAVAAQKEPVWERVFSARILGNSKEFTKNYKEKICTVLENYSPYREDGMNTDELLKMHGIYSYAQTLEWKGALQYELGHTAIIDTAVNIYGVVLNTQTLEHARPYALLNCKKIMTIENKANYESMCYEKETLYIFCHGYFTPKEVRFLRQLCGLVSDTCEFYHWGDMDYGGICIFQFIKEQVFPKLVPYKMSEADFKSALDAGAGMPLKKKTREKLEKKDAGLLTGLKNCILQTNCIIEQECLL